MFYFNPELAAGDGNISLVTLLVQALRCKYIYNIFLIIIGIDDGDEAISSYVREEDDNEEDIQYRELDTDRLAFEASETDTNGITVAATDRLKVNSVAENDKDVTGTIYNYIN